MISVLGTLWVQQISNELNLVKNVSNDTQRENEKNKKERFVRKKTNEFELRIYTRQMCLFYKYGIFSLCVVLNISVAS